MTRTYLAATALLATACSMPTLAAQTPNIVIPGISSAGQPAFDHRGLTVNLTAGGGGYTLSATGSTANLSFYTAGGPGDAYGGNGGTYSLTAKFDGSGNFIPTGSSLTITGNLTSTPPGSTGTPTGTLWSANLTNFGYNATQAALGFTSSGFGGWANQPLFTGGSTAESLYLYTAAGLSNGIGALSPLIDAFALGDLRAGVGTYNGVQSVATVPVPLPLALFGSGLAGLVGVGRFRRRPAVGNNVAAE